MPEIPKVAFSGNRSGTMRCPKIASLSSEQKEVLKRWIEQEPHGAGSD